MQASPGRGLELGEAKFNSRLKTSALDKIEQLPRIVVDSRTFDDLNRNAAQRIHARKPLCANSGGLPSISGSGFE